MIMIKKKKEKKKLHAQDFNGSGNRWIGGLGRIVDICKMVEGGKLPKAKGPRRT